MQKKHADCLTKCGMRAEVECAQLQKLESAWVSAFATVYEEKPSKVCEALNGWRVVRHKVTPSDAIACRSNRGAWSLRGHGMCVVGFTRDEEKILEVNEAPWARGSLSHEMVHAVDLYFYGRAGHCAWEARGVKDALEKVTGEYDPSEPDC